jgi:hypothetical protein
MARQIGEIDRLRGDRPALLDDNATRWHCHIHLCRTLAVPLLSPRNRMKKAELAMKGLLDIVRCDAKPLFALLIGLVIGLPDAQIALAQGGRGDPHTAGSGDWHGAGGGAHPGGTWSGSVGQWQSGRWYQGWLGNRYGWWWAVPGSDWYAYDEPLYPYPAFPDTGYPGAPMAPYYWYYCQNPAGYYPYVQQCGGAWQPVAPQS